MGDGNDEKTSFLSKRLPGRCNSNFMHCLDYLSIGLENISTNSPKIESVEQI